MKHKSVRESLFVHYSKKDATLYPACCFFVCKIAHMLSLLMGNTPIDARPIDADRLMPTYWCRLFDVSPFWCPSLLMPNRPDWCPTLLMSALFMPWVQSNFILRPFWGQARLMPVPVDVNCPFWCQSLLMPVPIDAHLGCSKPQARIFLGSRAELG